MDNQSKESQSTRAFQVLQDFLMNAESRMTHEGERVVRKKNIVISNSMALKF